MVPINIRIFNIEAKCIDNLIEGDETVDGSLLIDVLFDFKGFLFLP